MRVTLLHNPSAGDEDHGPEELERLLAGGGHDVVSYRSLKDDDWQEVLEEAVDVIVVAGGDGSVRKVFTAIGSSPTTAAVLPLGSANNIARSLGLDVEHAESNLERLDTARRAFDIWEVTSRWGVSRCVEAVGGGLFAQVLDRADDAAEEPSGSRNVDFGIHLLAKTLPEVRPRRWTVEIDGARMDEELLGVEAMNIRELGANLPFAPAADCGDGQIDVVIIRPEDRPQLIAYVAERLAGNEGESLTFDVRRGSDVVLEPPHDVPLHIDDVLPAWHREAKSWVTIRPADAHVQVLVPAHADR
jgi:diacylglycerol kinase (ATP)